jgi:hypothetical protein
MVVGGGLVVVVLPLCLARLFVSSVCIWEGLSLASFFPVQFVYFFFFFYEMTCSSHILFEKQKGKKVRYCLQHCLFPREI